MSISIDFTYLAENLKTQVHQVIKSEGVKAASKLTSIDNIQTRLTNTPYNESELIKQKTRLLQIKATLVEAKNILTVVSTSALGLVTSFKTVTDIGNIVVKLIKTVNKVIMSLATSLPLPTSIPPTGIATNITREASEDLSITNNTLKQVPPKLTQALTIITTTTTTALFVITLLIDYIDRLLKQIENTLFINKKTPEEFLDNSLIDKNLLAKSDSILKDVEKLCKLP